MEHHQRLPAIAAAPATLKQKPRMNRMHHPAQAGLTRTSRQLNRLVARQVWRQPNLRLGH
jgi:hypothetical protein